ncbi:MAG: hypothetical protein KGQ41_00160 [Alphaproteobacteria bacterium]|nr:hypothetical protein [Alphaproteobacteria bacterium]
MSRLLLLALSLVATIGLSACSSLESPPPSSMRSFKTYNYDAVDALLDRAGKNITKTTPMLVGTVGDVNDVESSSTLGRTITEQVSGRLAQKGYKVAELKLRQGINVQQGGVTPAASGEFLLSRDVRNISAEHKAAAAITGTYSVGASKVLVNLRLIDIRSGNVITGYDYELPKTADVMAMISNKGTSGYTFFSPDYAYQ